MSLHDLRNALVKHQPVGNCRSGPCPRPKSHRYRGHGPLLRLGFWLIALMLSACSVDTATQEAVASKQSEAAQQAPAVDSRQPEIAQQAPAVETGQPEPAKQSPAAPIAAVGSDAAPAPIDACAVDADCEVKDMGNCCGRMPACVNRAVVPDPAGVQAECARKGQSGICGFQELSGCTCVASRCVGVPGMGDGGDVR